MKHFFIEPEVAGGLGENTVMNRTVHPPVVSKLHYHFDGWLGDVILETFPCFIVTEAAKHELQKLGATGVVFGDVEVTVSEQFKELYPNRQIPNFAWLRVHGEAGREDFGIATEARLVVSERVLEVLQELGIPQALVTEFAG